MFYWQQTQELCTNSIENNVFITWVQSHWPRKIKFIHIIVYDWTQFSWRLMPIIALYRILDGLLINLIEIKCNYSHKLCIFLCFSFDNNTNISKLIASKFKRIERKHLNSCLVFDILHELTINELVLNCKCSCSTMCINMFNTCTYIVTYI